MQMIESCSTNLQELTTENSKAKPISLRHPLPGDLGWVVEKHGELYAQEHGWNGYFEALCARIVADFGQQHDPGRERCWIALKGPVRVGCVFVVKGSDLNTAKLRLLLLTPEARGSGLGKRLVEECIDFSQRAGYTRMELWTNNTLTAARRMYEKFGFRMVATEPHTNFGPALISETWTRDL